jgi:NADH-quinone oxidoreductase subunit M
MEGRAMTPFPWLTLLTLLPVAGAIAVLLFGRSTARTIAVSFAILALAVTLALWHSSNPVSGELQFQETHAWIPSLGVQYHLGVDGLSLLMLVLSAIVTLIGMAASQAIEKRVPLYYALVLLLESFLFGTFTAVNFVHWFLFWELALVPAFFLIALWGGPRAKPAAMQFLVYTMVGSVAMLLSFLALYLSTHTFEFYELTSLARSGQLMPAVTAALGGHWITVPHLATLLFVGVFLGFAVKVPVYPFHTWLPAAYSEAPSGTTAILTGAMSKMGLFGFVRILLPIFGPQMQRFSTLLLWLAVASIVLSAFSALAQKDLKRILAYSSINHLGYCLLAIFAVAKFTGGSILASEQCAALDGVFLQMFNHGLTAATLFWFVAMLEKRSGGLRGLDDFGGLRKAMPVFAGLMGISIFSSLGLPGLNGFPGEFLLFKGTFPLAAWSTALSILGLLATALFLLRILQRVFSGPLNPRWAAMPDLSLRERVLLVPATALMFVLGLYPQLILGTVNTTAIHLVQGLHP